jgi:hypothetical protein
VVAKPLAESLNHDCQHKTVNSWLATRSRVRGHSGTLARRAHRQCR